MTQTLDESSYVSLFVIKIFLECKVRLPSCAELDIVFPIVVNNHRVFSLGVAFHGGYRCPLLTVWLPYPAIIRKRLLIIEKEWHL